MWGSLKLTSPSLASSTSSLTLTLLVFLLFLPFPPFFPSLHCPPSFLLPSLFSPFLPPSLLSRYLPPSLSFSFPPPSLSPSLSTPSLPSSLPSSLHLFLHHNMLVQIVDLTGVRMNCGSFPPNQDGGYQCIVLYSCRLGKYVSTGHATS